MSRLMRRLGRLCTRRAYLVIAAWVLLVVAIGGGVLAYGRRTTNDVTLPGTSFQAATDLLRREFPPQQNGASPIVLHVTEGTLSEAATKQAVEVALDRVRAMRHVEDVTGPYGLAGKALMSEDETIGVAQVLLDINAAQVSRDLAEEVMAGFEPARAAGVQVEAGGLLGVRLSEFISRRSEIIGLGAGVVILAFTFGALVAAGMPIVVALVGLITGLGGVGLLGHVASIPVVAPTLATMLGLGVGIDYALFIVFRFRDELHRGAETSEAVARAMATSGSAVVFAGCTVVIALLALLVARVPMLGAMGYASALAVVASVLTAITLLPALLAILGRRIDGLRLPWRRRPEVPDHGENVWARWAGAVTRHPWVALIAALLVLLPLCAPTLTLRLGQEDLGLSSSDTTLRRAFDLIAEGLGPGANGPLVVALQFDEALTPSAPYETKRAEAEALADRLNVDGKKLEREAAALEKQGAALKTEEASLETQAASLQSRKASLEAQGSSLQAQQAELLSAKERLTAEKTRLVTKLHALEAQGEALAAQIAAVQQALAAAVDPAEIAALQAQLATLISEAQEVQARAAAAQKDLQDLAKQGERLAAQGKTLQTRGASLSAQGASLQTEGTRLASSGTALQQRGTTLQRQAALLKRRERELKRDAKTAAALKDELTDMLTEVGGEARATDPRLVKLQDALEATAGVESVAPPRVSEDGGAAVISLVATTRPADPATADLVAELRGNLLPAALDGAGATAHLGGITAAFDDLSTLISRRLPLVIGVVLALSFLILLVAFRSLLVPLKAILCNLLAVGASFGVVTAVFQWGWGIELLGIDSPYGSVPVASYVPLLMFAVLFGMSTDYEVFLISQIFGYHEAGENSFQAVRSGVGASARVITAAALIMVTVFGSFMLHPDPIIKQFGVGLSIAILLDASIVRLVIVPATMVLLGEWNWYLPRWLQWLHRFELSDHRGTAPER